MLPFLICSLSYFISVLLILCYYDITARLLPDRWTLLLLWSGLLLQPQLNICTLEEAVYGAALGYLLPWTVNKLYWVIRHQQGIGYGDFKLLAALGAWGGYTLILPILFFASCLALIFTLLLDALFVRLRPLPFGPYLALSGSAIILLSISIRG